MPFLEELENIKNNEIGDNFDIFNNIIFKIIFIIK